jgi:hypothetical protein
LVFDLFFFFVFYPFNRQRQPIWVKETRYYLRGAVERGSKRGQSLQHSAVVVAFDSC